MTKSDRLSSYRAKRDFKKTTEPAGTVARHKKSDEPMFMVHEHHASHLHWDLRIEIDGVLVSWAVPKGPSMNPADKRLAVMTEDHPLDYGSFEGVIPPGQYGAGSVMVWDTGTFSSKGDAAKGLKAGRLELELHGHKLIGGFALVRLRNSEKNWLFIKMRDAHASASSDIVKKKNRSAISGRTIAQIEAECGESNAGCGPEAPD